MPFSAASYTLMADPEVQQSEVTEENEKNKLRYCRRDNV
jgi:hypothetical protein